EQQNNSSQQYQGNQQGNQVRTATQNQVDKLIELSEQLSKAHNMNHQKTIDSLGIHEGMSEAKHNEVLKRITDGLQKVNKIGRASCREREKNEAVAVACEKKKQDNRARRT